MLLLPWVSILQPVTFYFRSMTPLTILLCPSVMPSCSFSPPGIEAPEGCHYPTPTHTQSVVILWLVEKIIYKLTESRRGKKAKSATKAMRKKGDCPGCADW